MIRFGTDGWRAQIAHDFTFENVARVASAFSRYCLESDRPLSGVVVSYDTRFLSEHFAEQFARVVASHNIPVLLSNQFTPTPLLSFSVKQLKLNAGVMVTASHNPYFYNGIKFKAHYGGPVLDDFTQRVQEKIEPKPVVLQESAIGRNLEKIDLTADYFQQIKKLLSVERLKRFSGAVVYDAMHGAGIGFLQHFFEWLDLPASYLHHTENPLFNRRRPEPVPENLLELHDALQEGMGRIGLATDGDADRCAVLDEQGHFVQLHDLLPLLARYLVQERKWPGHFVRTTSMHHTIDRLAGAMDRQVTEVPVGFKNVTEQMLQQDVLIGGEESGGFGFGFHLPERDGLLTILLVLEMLGNYQVPISELVNDLRREYGPFYYRRKDVFRNDVDLLNRNLQRLRDNPPARIGAVQVDDFNLKDGLKLYLSDESWVLMRVSQTEPLARIYVGGKEASAVENVLNWGMKELTKERSN